MKMTVIAIFVVIGAAIAVANALLGRDGIGPAWLIILALPPGYFLMSVDDLSRITAEGLLHAIILGGMFMSPLIPFVLGGWFAARLGIKVFVAKGSS